MNSLNFQPILANFGKDVNTCAVEPFGNGHIHSTYLVTSSSYQNTPKFILQHINQHVFPHPTQVMENITRVGNHLAQKANYPLLNLMPLLTVSDNTYYLDENGDYWRMFPFFEHTITFSKVAQPAQAYQAANAFAQFLLALSDFPTHQLHETIVGFHDSMARFEAFKTALQTGIKTRLQACQAEIDFVLATAFIFEKVVELGLPIRTTHNDTKLDNVLLDAVTHQGVCVIDLDTVMPGIILSDFGDMVRTFTNTQAEDSDFFEGINSEISIFKALASGFLDVLNGTLTPLEISSLVLGAKWMILEQAMRFLTDYLLGDTYYKVSYPEHNLVRTKNQLALFRSIIAQETAMEDFIAQSLK
ncbi:MAG: aminoglycoside phosphotransferase family protein [Saprospiraceae bacterium]|nr:aminoglycoside phosphotransferase family protein [Saprospiraceae bacterium]